MDVLNMQVRTEQFPLREILKLDDDSYTVVIEKVQ